MGAEGRLKGWAFPIRVGPGGGILLSADERRIEESIWLVLGTARGESAMSPEFGSRLAQARIEPGATSGLSVVEYLAREALAECEPRVDVLSVRAAFAPEDDRRVLIDVDYRHRATGAVGRTVYPHSLGRP